MPADLHGRLFRVEEFSKPNQADDSATEYFYEESGKLRKVCQDRAGTTCNQERLFAFDNRGFLTQEKHPEKGPVGAGFVTYDNFDSRGHAWRMQDGDVARTLKFEFDKAERLKLVEDAAGNDLKRFTFDTAPGAGLGKVHEAIRSNDIDGAGGNIVEVREVYDYSGLGGRPSVRYTKVAEGLPTALVPTDCWKLVTTYDPLGAPALVTYPQNSLGSACGIGATTPLRWQEFTYSEGLLQTVPGWTKSGVPIAYHPNLMVSTVKHANESQEAIANDPDQMARPASISATFSNPADNWTTGTYSYDGAGNITKLTNGTAVDRFKYDKVSRLREMSLQNISPSRNQEYFFDVVGNIDRIKTDGSSIYYHVSLTSNRLSEGASYDAAGNLTSWHDNTYQFDLLNTMSGLDTSSEVWSYVYTAADERLIAINAAAQLRTWTLRDFGNRLLRRLERRQSPPGRSRHGSSNPLDGVCAPHSPDQVLIFCGDFESGDFSGWVNSSTVLDKVTDYVWRGGQLLGAQVWGDSQSHFALDHLGTIRVISDDIGAAIAKHTYFGFGQEATSTSQDDERMKFTGHERDLQTSISSPDDDLDYLHARYRSPLTTRFLSTDPARGNPVAPQTWNRYTYSRNNPLLRLDSTGTTDRTFFEEFARDPVLQARIHNAPYSPDRNRIAAIALGPMMVAFTAPSLAAMAPEGAAATTFASALSGALQGALNNEANPLAGMLTGEIAGAGANVFIPGKQIGSAFKSMAEGAIVDAATGGSVGGAEVGLTGAFSSLSRSIVSSFTLLGRTLSNGAAATIDEGMKSLGGLIGGGVDTVHHSRNTGQCTGGASEGATCQ